MRPFTIRFHTVSYGPNPKRPRLIWATGQTPKAVRNVQSLLENALQKHQMLHPLLLHMTLARFRAEDFGQFKIKQVHEHVSWQDEIHAIVLMKSHLLRSGAEYEVLEKFSL